MAKKKDKKGKKPKKSKHEPGVEAVWIALLECFAAVDDVMTEHDAFAPGTIHKSLGRIYRQWLDSREVLDPDFDREKYRHDMKQRTKARTARSPLGRELPASTSRTSSTDRTSISEKSRKPSAPSEKPSAKASASTTARSAKSASTGASNTKSRSASGAASRSGSGKGSGSGSSKRATARSQKATR